MCMYSHVMCTYMRVFVYPNLCLRTLNTHRCMCIYAYAYAHIAEMRCFEDMCAMTHLYVCYDVFMGVFNIYTHVCAMTDLCV